MERLLDGNRTVGELGHSDRSSVSLMAAVALGLGCFALDANAGTDDGNEVMHCWQHGVAGAWASATDSQVTAPPTGTANESTGFDFDGSNDEGIICTWLVPPAFDNNAAITVKLGGWLTDNDACQSPPCAQPPNGTITWEVCSREYDDADPVNANWSSCNDEDFTIVSQSCIGLWYGRCADIYHQFDVDISSAADSGDLVFFRIRRLASSGNDTVNTTFHVPTAVMVYDTQ